MRVLVTGAAGFVGGHLLPELIEAGHEVVGTTVHGPDAGTGADGVRWIHLDLADTGSTRAAVAEADPDGVVHLAAQSSVGASFRDPLGTWEVNASGTVRLLDALRERGRPCPFVLASSAEVYGAVPEARQPISEEAPLAPRSLYAASKAAAEMAAVQATAEGVAGACIARSFNHTGPGQSTTFALPDFAEQIRSAPPGTPVRLETGDLSVRRDFLDVRDVVRAYRTLLERGQPGRAYNVSSGEAPTLRHLVDTLIEASGREVEVVTDEARLRPVDIPVLRGDAARLRALGWAPKIGLRRTLADLYESTPVGRIA